MEILDVDLVGADAANYIIAAGDTRRTVSPGAKTSIWVAFAPLSEGAKNDAVLRVHYNDGVEDKTKDINLAGTGVLN
jgi:hypothetical protein